MTSGDTITAISSATGAAPRMIVRLSGPSAIDISRLIFSSDIPAHACALQGSVRIKNTVVPAWSYVFKSPHSYTTEDTVEFHVPGNPLLARMLLEQLLEAGARAAEPGEFTARAYFNGRLDLTEAEGVAATISAGNEQELSAARRLMSGELARRLAPATDTLADTLALVEVGIDFSDEDVTFLAATQVASHIERVGAMLNQLLDESSRFERLSHEPVVLLAGRPNAGKSTLLNKLAGHERAVVSPVAGTTRDVLSAEIRLSRGIVRLLDVAGLEELSVHGDRDSAQQRIDGKMREHALRAMEEADHVVLVRDAADSRPDLALSRVPDLKVLSKCDLCEEDSDARRESAGPFVQISALSGKGIDALRDQLDRICFGDTSATSSLALNARHVRAIDEARDALERATALVNSGAEFVAVELRQALDSLGQISGTVSPDDLLGRVFSAFCIGK